MNPRERVLQAINHRKTDRIPANFQAQAEVTESLKHLLGLKDSEELLQSLAIDLRRISAPYTLPETGPDSDGYYTNMWGVRYQKENIDGKPSIIYPFDENTTEDEVENHPWPNAENLSC